MEIKGLATGTVTCQLAVTINDGADSDSRFDTIAPTGWVYLTPRTAAFTAGNPTPAIVVPDRLSLAVDDEGWATVPDDVGLPTSERTIAVPAVDGVTWQVSFDLSIPAYPWQQGVERNHLRIKPFDIPVEAGKTTQIADYLPLGVDPATGATWVKGERGTGIADAESDGVSVTFVLDTGDKLDPIKLPVSTVAGPKGEKGDEGERGPRGEQGPRGNDGAGIPSGGEAGQLPARTADGGARWETPAASSGENLFPNPDKPSSYSELWDGLTVDESDTPPGHNRAYKGEARTYAATLARGLQRPLDPEARYRVEIWLKADKPGSVSYLEVRGADDEHLFSNTYPAVSAAEVPTEWTRFTDEVKVGAETTGTMEALRLYLNHSRGEERTATVRVAGVRVEKIDVATSELSGAMSSEDKARLDTSPTSAQVTQAQNAAQSYADRAIAAAIAEAMQNLPEQNRGTPAAVMEFGETNGTEYEVIRVPGGPVPGLVAKRFGGDYGRTGNAGSNLKPPRETMQEHYEATGGSVLFNSGGWVTSGSRLGEVLGLQISGGKLLHDFQQGAEGSEALGFDAQGNAHLLSVYDGDTGESALEAGIVETFGYGPILVKNGTHVDIDNSSRFNRFAQRSGRQILGVDKTGSLVLITVKGRTGISGLGGTATAKLAADLGCDKAIMLDGGGSAQTVVNGHLVHRSSDAAGTRPVPVVGKINAVVPTYDTGWVDIPYPAGAGPSETGRELKVCMKDGVVYWMGTYRWASPITPDKWTKAIDVPDRFRWSGSDYYNVPVATPLGGQAAAVSITPEGTMFVKSPPNVSPQWVDLSSMTYRAL